MLVRLPLPRSNESQLISSAESDDETVVDHDEAEDSQDADEADGFVNNVAKVGIEAF